MAHRRQRRNILQQHRPRLLRALLHPIPSHPIINTAPNFLSLLIPYFLSQVGRTLHIHVQVHTNWTVTKNGTIDHSRVVETGQIYFDEKLTEELMAVEPYAGHTEIERVLNEEDGVFAQQVQCKKDDNSSERRELNWGGD